MGVTHARMMKLRGDLMFMKENSPGIKPNFSRLARETGISRQTIAKVWADPVAPSKPRQKKKSKFDPYYEEIRDKFVQNAVTIQAVFKYFQSRYADQNVFTSYNSFKSYVKANRLTEARGVSVKPRVRYETPPGRELQVDWKESLKMTLKTGEIIEFNIFTAVYGFSRYTKLIYSRTKTMEDFLRCVLETMESAGGHTDYIKTDNMSAVVKSVNGRKMKLPEIRQFEKDAGVPIQLCKVKNPQSKGKVESANRFISWLAPYQNELESEEQLIEAIETINRQINQEPSRTTGVPRNILMNKEKEHLRPLNKQNLLDHYFKDVDTQKVPNTLLVNWKGCGYSVPEEYIGKRVKLAVSDKTLRIYYNAKLIACHELTDKPINYHPDHYARALKSSMPIREGQSEENYQESISRKSSETLELLGKLKGKVK